MKMKNKIMASLALSVLCGAAVMAGGVLVDTATADSTITITMANGGSIRYDEPTGIRFETTYSGDFTSVNVSGYSFGTLVLPTDKLGENELTHETADVVDIVKKVWYSDTDTNKVLYAVITGIEEENYGRELAARSYYRDNSTGEYTYSTTTVKRSVAQVAANRLNMGDTEAALWTYVNAVAQDVTVSTSTLEMVVGGKETLTATTSPANYNVVWSSADETIATVDKNGTIMAVSKGTVEITAKFGEYEDICTVTIGDYIQKDGSEFTYTTASPTADPYAATTETVGGRTGVYKYASGTTSDWTNKIKLNAYGHYSNTGGDVKKVLLREWKDKGYNYATFDIYMTKGSLTYIAALETSTTYVTDKLTADGAYEAMTASVGDNEKVQVYNLGSEKEVSKIAHDTWYTVVVDYSEIVVADYAVSAATYIYIEVGGIKGTIYLDNVRYYANDSWKSDIKTYNQFDGSEFVRGSSTLSDGAYEFVSGENDSGRTGVYKFTSASSWSDKISLKQTNHIGVATYSDANIARKNMINQGYKYVTFEIYVKAGTVAICAPEYTVADNTYTWVAQSNSKVSTTGFTLTNSRISFYLNETEVTSFSEMAWFTVVIEYDVDSEDVSGSHWAGIDICASAANTVAYIDNVRYYSANPFAA